MSSTTIDKRVVEMQFDNGKFESNVKTSMNSIEKLKGSLNFDESAKSLENLDASANNISFDSLLSSVKSLEERFSTFGVVGMRVIENLTDSIMGLASKTVSFLTNGIVSGGITRAMNLENAHFQLQGLLKDEEAVEAVMQNVNDAVDGTAYSLDAAAMVASQLAASGMTAGDEMFSSLRAVAGVAAMTNSEYSDIGNIFTTVAGNGRLMSEQLLQLSSRGLNAAATLAEYLGKTEAEVREMVSAGEIDFQTFADAMDDAFGEHAKNANQTFTGALSNIKAALGRIGAEFVSPLIEQNGVLVQLFNTLRERINDVKANIGPLAEMFVDFVSSVATSLDTYFSKLDLTKPFEAFYNIVEAIQNVFKGFGSVIKPVAQAFAEVFPAPTIDQAVSLSETLIKLSKRLTLSEESAAKLKQTFKGVFSAIDIGISFIKELLLGIKNLLTNFNGFDLNILNVTSSIGKFVEGVKDSIEETGVFGTIFSTITGFIQSAIDKIKEFTISVKGIFEESGVSSFTNLLSGLWNVVKMIFSGIGELLNNIGNSSFSSILSGGVLATLAYQLKNLFYSFRNVFGYGVNGKGGFLSSAHETLNQLKSTLVSYQNNLKTDSLLKLAEAIAILAGSMFVISTLDAEALGTSISTIGLLLGEMVTATTALNKFAGSDSDNPIDAMTNLADSFADNKRYTGMIKMAAAVAILSGALFVLTKTDQDKLGSSLAAITGLFADLTASMILFSKFGGKTSGLTTMIGMAAAVYILSQAIKSLADLEWEGIGKGITAVTVLCAELVAAMIALNKFGGSGEGALLILALAAALKILASVCQSFAEMSWEEIGKGLASVGGLLAELAMFTLLAGNMENMASIGFAMIEIAAAMKIFASAMEDFAKFSWEEIGKGLLAMGVALAEVAIAVNYMPENMAGIGAGMVIMGAALEIIAHVIGKMGAMSWETIGKGLLTMGASLAEFAIALRLMTGTVAGSAALLVAVIAIDLLTPALKALGSMSIASIAKALIVLAGAFTIIGVAATVLSPLILTITALAGAFTLIGIGVAAIGIGLVAAGAGIAAIAVGITSLAGSLALGLNAIVLGIKTIVLSIISLIPDIAVAIGEGFVQVVGFLAENAPAIASSLLEMVLSVIASLNEYVPQIVASLMQFIVGVIKAVAENIPELVTAVMDLVGSLFSAVLEAFNGLDTSSLIEGIMCVGLLAALVAALSAISGMIPAAVVALAELGIFVAEMAAVFGAIGALAQIPGLTWLIDEGAALMESIGGVIGSFVGGIVGGFMGGVSSHLVEIGNDLSAFMESIQPFIEGVSNIDASAMSGVNALAKTILTLTAAELLDGLTSWFTGGSSLADFGKELATFGTYFADYYDEIQNVDGSVVEASANAATALAAMAKELPNSGGFVSLITGDNSLAAFAEELAEFGPALQDYSDSVADVKPGNVRKSANAATALFEMAGNLPDRGGIIDWFTGSNSLSAFGKELAEFGPYLKEYSDVASGVNSGVVVCSSIAGRALFAMAENLPDRGGIIDWFTGSNSLSAFGKELAKFGPYLKDYSDYAVDIKPGFVISSANAGQALFEMAENLPDRGGIVDWFTGSNTLSAFGKELAAFGPYLSDYSENVSDVKSGFVISSANAATALAEMADTLPDQGGIVDWFTGSNTLSSFGAELAAFGPYLSDYSEAVADVKPGYIRKSANAGTALFDMAKNLPNQGGLVDWFTGSNTLSAFGAELAAFGEALVDYSEYAVDIKSSSITDSANAGKAIFEMAQSLPVQNDMSGLNTLSSFGAELEAFGPHLKGYAESVDGLKESDVSDSAAAATALFEMAKNLPNQGGIVDWFTGSNTLSAFGAELEAFGPHLTEYADSVEGINEENVTKSVRAGESLIEMAKHLPDQGGIVDWFTGSNSLSSFGEELVGFGKYLVDYSDYAVNVKSSSITDSANAATVLVDMLDKLSDQKDTVNSGTLASFGTELEAFGESLKSYSGSTSDIDSVDLSGLGEEMKKLMEVITDVSGIDKKFSDNLEDLAESGISSFVKTFKKSRSTQDIKAAAKSIITSFMNVIEDKENENSVKTAFANLLESVITTIRGKRLEFWRAGKYLVEGFADGISSNTYQATAKSKEMAKAAADAAAKELDEHSPSKVGYRIGNYFGVAFVNAIGDKAHEAYDVASELAGSAKTGLGNAISKVRDVIDGGLDTTPTIRPVLDLSNIKSGTSMINNMFSRNPALAVDTGLANSVSYSMREFQNGDGSGEILSAINRLNKNISGLSGNSYYIDGITYDDGSNVSSAIESLIRAAMIDRRV